MHRKLASTAVWILLSIALAAAAGAQAPGRLEGKVTRPDGTALAGVSVRIDPLGQVTLTDGSGAFLFTGVPAGSYDLTFSLSDHSAREEAVQVAAGATRTVDKKVDWDVSFAETITVTSVSRREERITEAPAAVTVVPPGDIEREAASGQVPKLLEYSPGVDFTQSGLYDFNFNTRGFNSSLNRRILTLVDGRDPSVPFLGSQEWAALSFPMDELANVELVRGPGSALYGANAFSGVLNMVTKSPRGTEGGKVRLTGGELDTRRGDLRFATRLGEGIYGKIMGGYQTSDDFTVSRTTTADYGQLCTAAGQINCLPREAVPLAKNDDKIAFGGLRLDKYLTNGAALTLEGGTASIEGPTFVTGIGRVQVTDTKRPWGRFNFNTVHWNLLGYYDKRVAKDQVALSSGAHLFEDSSNLHGELQGNAGFAGGKGFLVGGVAFHQQKVDTANDAGVQTLMAEAKDEHQSAVFGQAEYSFTGSLKGVVAARVDKSTLHDTEVSPKASLVYALGSGHTVRLTYNQAFQVPNYSEFFLRAPAGRPITAFAPLDALVRQLTGQSIGLANIPIFAFGNDQLTVEKIKSYEAGYSGVLSSRFYVTLDYYRSSIDNFVTDLLPGVNSQFAPYQPPSFLPAPLAAQVLGALRALGANFAGLTTVNGQPTLVLSYANAGNVDTQGVDVGINYYATNRWVVDLNYSWFDFKVKEQLAGDRLLPNAPENKLSAGVTYTGERASASVKYRWVDGFPWAAGVFVGDVPSYNLVDVAADYKVADHFSVGLDVSNLFDKKHWQSWGGDLLKRRALGHVTFSW